MNRGKWQEAAVPKARALGAFGRGRCAYIFGVAAAAAAGVGAKNAVSFLVLTSGSDASQGLEGFFMPFGLGTLICVALGLRPAPGRPATATLDPSHGEKLEWPPRTPPNPPKYGCRIALYKADDGPMRSAFENQSQRYPLTGVAMKRCRVTGVAVNNQMTLRNVWGRPSRGRVRQPESQTTAH